MRQCEAVAGQALRRRPPGERARHARCQKGACRRGSLLVSAQLLPPVEVCGSPRTLPDVIRRVCRDLRAAGSYFIRLMQDYAILFAALLSLSWLR